MQQKLNNLISEYRPSMNPDVIHSWVKDLFSSLKENQKLLKNDKISALVKEYRPSMNSDVLHSWVADILPLIK